MGEKRKISSCQASSLWAATVPVVRRSCTRGAGAGWVGVAPWHGPARREVSPWSRADVLGLRHLENASCWQHNTTVRVKVKLLAVCIPPELSQSGVETPPTQRPKSLYPPVSMASPVPPAPRCGWQTVGTRWSRGDGAAAGRHRCWAAPDISACECPANWRGWSSDTWNMMIFCWKGGGKGERVGGPLSPLVVCMPGAAERTGQSGVRGAETQHPGDGPVLPAPWPGGCDCHPGGLGADGSRGTLLWGARPGDPLPWGTRHPWPRWKSWLRDVPWDLCHAWVAGAVRCRVAEGWAFLGALGLVS